MCNATSMPQSPSPALSLSRITSAPVCVPVSVPTYVSEWLCLCISVCLHLPLHRPSTSISVSISIFIASVAASAAVSYLHVPLVSDNGLTNTTRWREMISQLLRPSAAVAAAKLLTAGA